LLFQKLERRRSFSATDNFTITFRREYVDSQREFRTLRL
jgi:hypothetical protein